jgi:hypothetical protein
MPATRVERAEVGPVDQPCAWEMRGLLRYACRNKVNDEALSGV